MTVANDTWTHSFYNSTDNAQQNIISISSLVIGVRGYLYNESSQSFSVAFCNLGINWMPSSKAQLRSKRLSNFYQALLCSFVACTLWTINWQRSFCLRSSDTPAKAEKGHFTGHWMTATPGLNLEQSTWQLTTDRRTKIRLRFELITCKSIINFID